MKPEHLKGILSRAEAEQLRRETEKIRKTWRRPSLQSNYSQPYLSS
jgi:hypothetical protein